MLSNSKIWLINGLLAIALVVGCVKIWDVWHEPPAAVVLSDPEAVTKSGGRAAKRAPEKRLENDARYAEIVDQNLFSADRAPAPPPPPEPAEGEPEPEKVEAEVRISGEKVVLYGVVMLDDYKKALTNDPADRTVQTRWISEGDKIGNLVVREIAQDNIVLADSEKIYRVLLYDPEKAAKAGRNNKAASVPQSDSPQVVSAGSVPKQTPSGASAGKGAATGTVSTSAVSADAKDQEEYESIVTPFGTIKRKKR